MRKLNLLVLVFAVAAVLAAAALAAKGPSISLDQKNPAVGDSVTFTLSALDPTSDYRVNLDCYQSQTLVFTDSHFLPAGTTDAGVFTLTWASGSARCTAFLVAESVTVDVLVDSHSFRVSG